MTRILMILIILFGTTFGMTKVVAQITGPLTTTFVIFWAAPSNVTLATASTLEYRLYVDSDTVFTILSTKTCGPPIAPDLIATCQQTVPATALPVLNTIGSHNIRLTAYSASANLESEKSLPFVLRTPPAAPGNLRITK